MEDLELLDDEAKSLVLNYIVTYLELQKEKKLLQRKISDNKKRFKELGLPVNLVMRAYNTLLEDKSDSEETKQSLNIYKGWIETSNEITELTQELENM